VPAHTTPDLPASGSEPLLLNIYDVAARLRLSRASVQRLLTSGELPSVKIGRTRRVLLTDLHQFVAGLARESGRSTR